VIAEFGIHLRGLISADQAIHRWLEDRIAGQTWKQRNAGKPNAALDRDLAHGIAQNDGSRLTLRSQTGLPNMIDAGLQGERDGLPSYGEVLVPAL
jgi:hypothetical protein